MTDPNNARYEVPLELAFPPYPPPGESTLKMEIGRTGNLQVVDSRTGDLK